MLSGDGAVAIRFYPNATAPLYCGEIVSNGCFRLTAGSTYGRIDTIKRQKIAATIKGRV